ncbi:TetR/AcrR family transcriptional regulator [Thermocrispum agreste]|uniref:TetR/AcrR family transcriptional regulator n=1 Tax=Thermocrispum agreste TaxID=37925 RepID=UPI000428274A|nr:TetR/AcrR family transcriptional regulator [Thermocrispum agreste]
MTGRPDSVNPNAATRDRILEAAAALLSKKGYSATRLTDIADLASVRAPALYYYFESRQDLIAEVMATGQRRLRAHVEAALDALDDDASPLDRIGAAVAAHLEVELSLSDFATAVSRNLGQLPDEVRDRLRAEGTKYIELWRRLLEQARRAGAIRPDLDLRAARMLVIGALNWTTEWWDPRQGSLAAVIDTAKNLVRHGLSAPAERRNHIASSSDVPMRP